VVTFLNISFSRLAEYNPKLQEVSAATRVAYAKFKTKMLMSHINEEADSEQGTPKPKSKTWTSSKKRKIRGLRTTRSSSVVDSPSLPRSEQTATEPAAKPPAPVAPKKVSIKFAKTTEETPIVTPLKEALKDADKIEKAEGVITEKAGRPMVTSVPKQADDGKQSTAPASEPPKPSAGPSKETTGKAEKPKTEEKSGTSGPVDGKQEPAYTVVQIESTGVEDGQKPGPSSSVSQPAKPPVEKAKTPEPEPSGSRRASLAPPAPSPAPPSPSHSTSSAISPKGKSAVTGQTRTGWI